ncbi:putative cyclin-dependent kinase regulatory subunit CKS1 [Paratrimastix pyriformis]|uniref:Cyclin-dependent kinases regulatory subunit n=1 Tax=Paratrimastix pyriformis TaxID=342808 RepID=A0ABQ8UDX3_9EUKA|nr:putative cyclin-dependent kinase regulatory subunit CKS1 [Paratrimastix pyriformis]|eukprot:GAFH01005179.1.p2 GENE.GAFH01005179.1~~GAFH01005179.1.p2  ORF type:complete len:104 (+),score=1.80 GAFH01005179.1:1-312(+)
MAARKPAAAAAAQPKKEDIASKFFYSEKVRDDVWEYRHVICPKELIERFPKSRLMREDEWRGLGIQMSPGWVHYDWHAPEPHVLLFRRAIAVAEEQAKAQQLQ